jgi:hypothetical protein
MLINFQYALKKPCHRSTCLVLHCVIASPRLKAKGELMPPAAQYQFVHATPVQMEAAFPPLVAQGWKPMLMSSAMSDNGQLKVFIILEKPIGT